MAISHEEKMEIVEHIKRLQRVEDMADHCHRCIYYGPVDHEEHNHHRIRNGRRPELMLETLNTKYSLACGDFEDMVKYYSKC